MVDHPAKTDPPPLSIDSEARGPSLEPLDRSRWTVRAIAAGVVALLAAGGGWYVWQERRAQLVVAAPEPVAAAPAPSAPAAASVPAIQHPIDDAAADASPPGSPPTAPVDADAALRAALAGWLGDRVLTTWLLTDDFARRVVVTVDNLGRSHAAPRWWPVAPMPGRFAVEPAGDSERIAASNAARYDAFVAFAGALDVQRAAQLYRRHYLLFQRAYQELGYPDGYFNDRLVAVIDQLLATPEPATPPTVRLTLAKGPIAGASSDRPWTRYEFADPALDALPAGPKMLLRMGPQHAQRLKAQLRAFRAEIARRR